MFAEKKIINYLLLPESRNCKSGKPPFFKGTSRFLIINNLIINNGLFFSGKPPFFKGTCRFLITNNLIINNGLFFSGSSLSLR